MRSRLRSAVTVVLGRRARLRWLYQILGGALLMPYFFVAVVAVELSQATALNRTSLGTQFVAYLLSLPLVALTATVPMVRTLEVAAVRVLLGTSPDLRPGPAVGWPARWRAGVYYTTHLAVGGLVAGLTLAVPPAAALFLVLPLLSAVPGVVAGSWVIGLGGESVAAPLMGLGALALLAGLAAAGGAGLARLAVPLLGPTPAQRLAEAEHRAAQRLAEAERRATHLAERNRLAGELHDSVGHALSIIAVQAAAASRLLARDPAFAGRAVEAIAETARAAMGDLDHVLGLLREDRPATAPQASLGDLARLVAQAGTAGVEVRTEITGPVGALPATVSREAYRIVQEGITNVLRHAGAVPVTLRVAAAPGGLTVELTNPLGFGAGGLRGGGRGLRGVAERVALLDGEVAAGPVGDTWRLAVHLPLGPGTAGDR